MSNVTEGTSSSAEEKPKKKKRYLYLDKFESYKNDTDNRIALIDKKVSTLVLLTIIAGLAGIASGVLAFIYLN